MFVQDFVIPFNREDLLKCSNDGRFYVRGEYTIEEIRERLEAAANALNEEGTDFVVDHFTTFFSLLQKFHQCPQLTREKGWKTIRKAFDLLSRNLQIILEDSSNLDSEIQSKMCNLTKMITYLLIELMKSCQDQYVKQNSVCLDGKGKKKQVKVGDKEWDWNEEKNSVLVEIHTFLQLPLKLLWEPPVVDEDFINLIANFCYYCLEDQGISGANAKYLRETIFQILGILIRNYLHGLSFCVKVVQLLKMNDHLTNTLAQGIVYLVQVSNCTNIVKEIVREVAETDGDQLAADAAGTRNLNLFLVQMAESIPEAIIPAIDLLISHLNGDSYSMRICIIGVLGEIVLNVLTKEVLDENMKKMRDEYLDCLEEHIHDVNAFVRTKVLHIWQKLCTGKAIPISRTNKLLELVIGRLNDKSTNVKKQAVHLIKNMLEGNPFCSQLNIAEIQSQLQQERKNLEAIEIAYNLKNDEAEWKELEKKLRELLEEIDDEEEFDLANDEEEAFGEDIIDAVKNFLSNGDCKSAIGLLIKLKNDFFRAYGVKKENFSSEALIEILGKIFKEKKKSLNVSPEVGEQLEKREATIKYLESALEFSQFINRALHIILTFLDSSVVTDVLEAIHFFSAAYLFGFKEALEGIRKMLYLIFSKESSIKSAVSTAYKDIYFQTTGSGRSQSIATINSLSELVMKLNFNQLEALEEVIKQWVKEEVIDKHFVQVMFERFSMKLPGTKSYQSWAALVLIRMVGAQEPKIIKSNVSVLLSEGLEKHGFKNFVVAKETCKALQHLLPRKEQGKSFDQTLRLPRCHEVFGVLYRLLKSGIWNVSDSYYVPMADEAINLVFAICDQPDEFCKDLIVDIHESILSGRKSAEKKELTNGNFLNCQNGDDLLLEEPEKDDDSGGEKECIGGEKENSSEVFIKLLTRFISILGQVASNYVLYLEGPVLDELKLQNQLDYERRLKRLEENKNVNVSMRKNRKRAGAEHGGDRNLQSETGPEDLEFSRVAADDVDAEEMKKKTENEIVIGEGFLAKFAPLILAVCKNPGKFNSGPLQNAALLALAKFMQVSSIFCEENLQLLVTICEKSQVSERQENAIIALGVLQYRFPNSLEPWTPHMYGMLQNPNPGVRFSSILILTDLIVNEMIKVRSHISNLAICIVDKEVKIARVARHFFREYSQKGNALFNVLPSLISNLTQSSESHLTQEEFKTVMKYILSLVTKEKQSESLVEKLCQYFESAATERQWADLAYCLSLLNLGDKGLKKIIENFKCFAGKLYLAEVYEAFCGIVSQAGKNPQRDKSLVGELSEMVKEFRGKVCEGKVCVSSSSTTLRGKQCPPSAKKKVAKKKYLPSDSDEELEEMERRTNQRKRKNLSGRRKDSDEDEEEDLFSDDCAEEGKISRRRTSENKENDFFENSDSGESTEEETRKRIKSKANKKIKGNLKTMKESSEDEEKGTKAASLRSSRKRK